MSSYPHELDANLECIWCREYNPSGFCDDRKSEEQQKTEAPQKDTEGKHDWSLLPFSQLEEVVRAFEWGTYHTPRPDGSKGYGVDNWKTHKPENAKRYYFAANMRHLLAWWGGETRDPSSGCHHLAHVVANCLILMFHEDERLGRGDYVFTGCQADPDLFVGTEDVKPGDLLDELSKQLPPEVLEEAKNYETMYDGESKFTVRRADRPPDTQPGEDWAGAGPEDFRGSDYPDYVPDPNEE